MSASHVKMREAGELISFEMLMIAELYLHPPRYVSRVNSLSNDLQLCQAGIGVVLDTAVSVH